MKVVITNNAPAAVGPYSQAIVVNNFVFCSGQIGINPKTGNLVDGIENQIKQVLFNLQAVLEVAGSDIKHVVKTTVYLKNMSNYPLLNQLYGDFFNDHKPARATAEVSNLPKDCLIEIDAIAVKN
ncbi:MAG: RidA family protein [Patescibacteria group bacterium]